MTATHLGGKGLSWPHRIAGDCGKAMFLEQIIVLSLIQGITEFLPISSSGHAVLVPLLLGWPDQGELADAVINFGTVAAVIIYFWRDVVGMLQGAVDLAKGRWTEHGRLAFHIVIATIPVILLGLVLHATHLDEHLRNPTLIAVNTIVFGVILYLTDHYGLSVRALNSMNWRSALIIGVAQAFSLSKGTSRSGITISAARSLGFMRTDAARFSFLMSIPANGAASLFKVASSLHNGETISGGVVLTTVLTFFIGLGTIALLMRLIRTISFLHFTVYRVLLGGILLGLIYSGMSLVAVN
jgi:undecaprenyl-diphosphatase